MTNGYQVAHDKLDAPHIYRCDDCGVHCACLSRALKMARAIGHGATVTRVRDGALLSRVLKVGRLKDETIKPLRKGRVNRQWGDTREQRARLEEDRAA